MTNEKIKLIAFDLDGTLTQHKTPLGKNAAGILDRLSEKHKLLMVGAGTCRRIYGQMNSYPIDIIGNYGMEYAVYVKDIGDIEVVRSENVPCDCESVEKRVTYLREKYGYTEFTGDNVEYHPSGCVTIPLLGTKAKIEDKLAFDPDKKKRRVFYSEVRSLFPDFNVFIGGSSSFDMSPAPFNKAYALDIYCKEHGLSHSEVAYVGDDYGEGGNDESVFKSDFNFIKIDDYRDFPAIMEKTFLK